MRTLVISEREPTMIAWIKRQLKRSQRLVALKRKFVFATNQIFHSRDIRIIQALPAFAPNSAGAYRERARLTLLSARQTFPFLAQLISDRGRPRELLSVDTFANDERARAAATQIKMVFDKHGSDKSIAHDYHHLYGTILAEPNAPMDILEIGLGTNNTDVVSNMGDSGIPGASLKAFKEFLPRARIYGADVDKRILFEEDRIKTFFVDQTDFRSFNNITDTVGHKFDLIIDDGLHSPNANIATLAFALHTLKQDGWFVVEDICLEALPVWEVVAALLADEYSCWLVSARGGYLFVVRNSSPGR